MMELPGVLLEQLDWQSQLLRRGYFQPYVSKQRGQRQAPINQRNGSVRYPRQPFWSEPFSRTRMRRNEAQFYVLGETMILLAHVTLPRGAMPR